MKHIYLEEELMTLQKLGMPNESRDKRGQISRIWYYIFSTTGVHDQLENIFL